MSRQKKINDILILSEYAQNYLAKTKIIISDIQFIYDSEDREYNARIFEDIGQALDFILSKIKRLKE